MTILLDNIIVIVDLQALGIQRQRRWYIKVVQRQQSALVHSHYARWWHLYSTCTLLLLLLGRTATDWTTAFWPVDLRGGSRGTVRWGDSCRFGTFRYRTTVACSLRTRPRFFIRWRSPLPVLCSGWVSCRIFCTFRRSYFLLRGFLASKAADSRQVRHNVLHFLRFCF